METEIKRDRERDNKNNKLREIERRRESEREEKKTREEAAG